MEEWDLTFYFTFIDSLWISYHTFRSQLSPCPIASALCPCTLPPKQNQIEKKIKNKVKQTCYHLMMRWVRGQLFCFHALSWDSPVFRTTGLVLVGFPSEVHALVMGGAILHKCVSPLRGRDSLLATICREGQGKPSQGQEHHPRHCLWHQSMATWCCGGHADWCSPGSSTVFGYQRGLTTDPHRSHRHQLRPLQLL